MKNLKDQLAGIAALIAAIIAIGGGFVKYGEVMTKIDVLENASKGIDMSFLSEIKVLEEKKMMLMCWLLFIKLNFLQVQQKLQKIKLIL